jgi:hypothetical protein
MDVVVQPSVPWMSLNDQIKGSGLFFPVDPGPSVSPSHFVGQEFEEGGPNRGRESQSLERHLNSEIGTEDSKLLAIGCGNFARTLRPSIFSHLFECWMDMLRDPVPLFSSHPVLNSITNNIINRLALVVW